MFARASVNPRASTYSSLGTSGGAVNYVPAAQACVAQAETCADLIQGCVAELENGTRDMERLAKIMHNTRLYVLIDEPTLRQVKSDVVEAIEPQVEKLISEGEKAIANMEKSVTSLQRKADYMKNRVAAPPAADPHAGAPLQVRNEVRKKKLLAKQEKTLEQQLVALQQEIDDLELEAMSLSSNQRARAASRQQPVGRKR
ncbi:hypothetical protein FS837_010014 [Tulasnella sp. UAMH 9824]|nr:hypothetical protein FS837_010014 [Tulasnella sp. UAMH 9824]